MARKDDRRALAHSDDPDVRAANDLKREMRQFALQGERSHEAGTARAEDDNRRNFHALSTS